MKRKEINSARMPVYREAGFELNDAITTGNAFAAEVDHLRDPEKYIYSRYRNPTVAAAEEAIMSVEGSEWALLTQSGMAAVDTAISIFQDGTNTKPMLFFNEIYGGTVSYVDSVLKRRRGVEVSSFHPNNGSYSADDFDRKLAEIKPGVVYMESVSNPMLIVADLAQLIGLAHRHGAKVIVDNTFPTPMLVKPLELGADIVIHSATKYLSGHGNLTAGALCGNDPDIMKQAIEYRKFVGHMLSPDDAYRITTHLYSFHLRFAAQCSNASSIANILVNSAIIRETWYPGLPTHPTHKIALALFKDRGYGAMVTFSFDGENDEKKRGRRDTFIESVYPDIRLIPTLGDAHTILMPVEAVWGYKYPDAGMIRLSVGFEETTKLLEVINRGLDAAAGPK